MTPRRRTRGAPAVVLAAVLGAAVAQAQSPPSVTMPQISAGPTDPSAQAVRIPPITGVGANGPRRSDAASAPTQVGNGVRPATTVQSLSSPAQGRVVSVPTLTGSDKCEPGSSLAASQICAQRIETRADQYQAPSAAPVTAEGRLLILMTPTGQQATDDAARRIGDGGADLRDFVGQAAGQITTALDQQKNGVPAAPADLGTRMPQGLTGLPPTAVINPGR